jgi:hypothetical protein
MSSRKIDRKPLGGRPRVESDNAYDDVHEHPTEWPDEVSVEPGVPHPRADPVETTTEPRPEHPERSGKERTRPRGGAPR